MSGGNWPNSKRNQVRQFFLDNPDEFLTLQDLCQKFGFSDQTARSVVSDLRKGKLIRTEHTVTVYRREPA